MAKQAKVSIWDVDRGLSVHVVSPNGKRIVIDLGTGERNPSPIYSIRNEKISFMVITHPHQDHISDIAALDYVKPHILLRPKEITNEYLLSGSDKDNELIKKYCEINSSYSQPVALDNVDSIANPDNYGGLSIVCFSSNEKVHSDINENSIITILSIGSRKIVVCGDNGEESLSTLMKVEKFKSAVSDAYVLIAPHHGLDSSFYEPFVSLVNPYITVISDGRHLDRVSEGKYASHSKGWSVYRSGVTVEKCQCISTRKFGNIFITFGESENEKYTGLLNINTEK